MKRGLFICCLFAEGALCAALFGLNRVSAQPDGMLAVQAVQALSELGRGGRFAFWAIYVFVCAVPLFAACWPIARRGIAAEDALTVLSSALLFRGAWLAFSGTVFRAIPMLGAAASVFCAYIVAVLLRRFKVEDAAGLLGLLGSALRAVAAVVVFSACGPSLGELASSLREGVLDPAFAVFRYAVSVLPCALDLLLLWRAGTLLRELRRDRWSDDALLAAGALSRLCSVALGVSAGASAAFNLIQLLCLDSLTSVDARAVLPLGSIVLTLALLLLTRLLGEGRDMREDNDMII